MTRCQIGLPAYGIEAVRPPSTGMAWPLTYDASSLTRNNPIAARSSCGWPALLQGDFELADLVGGAALLGAVEHRLGHAGLDQAGHTALIRTPVPDSE